MLGDAFVEALVGFLRFVVGDGRRQFLFFLKKISQELVLISKPFIIIRSSLIVRIFTNYYEPFWTELVSKQSFRREYVLPRSPTL